MGSAFLLLHIRPPQDSRTLSGCPAEMQTFQYRLFSSVFGPGFLAITTNARPRYRFEPPFRYRLLEDFANAEPSATDPS